MNKSNSKLFIKKIKEEKERLIFIEKDKNKDEAIKFAKTTLLGYKKAILNKDHFASDRKYKYKFIASCIVFKEYLKNPNSYLTSTGDIMLPNIQEETKKKQRSISRMEMENIVKRLSSETLFKERIDYIIAIARGGIELGKMFSVALKKPMFIIDYSSKKGNGNGKGNVEDFPTIRWKNLLLVDDILDSGHTLKDIEKFYLEMGCNTKTFALYYNTDNECNIKNIFYNKKLSGEDKPWIVFPWERGYRDFVNNEGIYTY